MWAIFKKDTDKIAYPNGYMITQEMRADQIGEWLIALDTSIAEPHLYFIAWVDG